MKYRQPRFGYSPIPHPSPVDRDLAAGPRGNADWPAFGHVYGLIAAGCEAMARKCHLSDDHVSAMADLGSGHEERMKARLLWMREYGYV